MTIGLVWASRPVMLDLRNDSLTPRVASAHYPGWWRSGDAMAISGQTPTSSTSKRVSMCQIADTSVASCW